MKLCNLLQPGWMELKDVMFNEVTHKKKDKYTRFSHISEEKRITRQGNGRFQRLENPDPRLQI